MEWFHRVTFRDRIRPEYGIHDIKKSGYEFFRVSYLKALLNENYLRYMKGHQIWHSRGPIFGYYFTVDKLERVSIGERVHRRGRS